jgi:hypothetical protein
MKPAKEKHERLPIKIFTDQRPPSRHKTPQRAVGLEYLRGTNKHSNDSLDVKMLDIESDESSSEKHELSFTTPLRKNSVDPTLLRKNNTKRSDLSLLNNGHRAAKHASVARAAKKAWEWELDNKSERKTKMITPKQAKNQYEEDEGKRQFKVRGKEIKIGSFNSSKKKPSDIPLIVNKRDSLNLSYPNIFEEAEKVPDKLKRPENTSNLQEGIRKRRSRNNVNIRTKSNPYKNRFMQNLGFSSTLEPEFLKLFAQDDVVS